LLDDQIETTHSFHIINVGYFISGIIPLRLGDVARAWLTTRLERPVPGLTALSTVLVERLLDLLAVLAILGLTLFLIDVPSEVSSAGAILSVMALSGGVFIVLFAIRPDVAHRLLLFAERIMPVLKRFDLHEWLAKLLAGIQPMSNPRIAAKALLWSGISWLFSIGAGYVYLFIIFDDPPLSAALAYIVLASFSVALPAVPGNLGPFEGAVVGGLWIGGLVSSASTPQNAPAVAFAAILHGATLAIYIILGVIGLYYEQASLYQITQESRTITQPKAPNPTQLSDKGKENTPLVDIAPERVS
jgi:uncharacterized protein (TIRG00374 family)